jgi:hypothetical protein
VVLGTVFAFPHNRSVNSEYAVPAFLRLRSGRPPRLSRRHFAYPLLAVSFAALLSTSAATKSRHSPALSSSPDRAYASALAAANRFLQAWQNQDHETGLLMLTDAAKHQSSEDRLEMFFSSGSDSAYEIARGKKLKAGRYAFPITLFVFHSGTTWSDRPQKSEIVVVRTGKDEWAIDKLP